MVKLLTIIFLELFCCICVYVCLAPCGIERGGGIIDVCNDPDIFEKILVKAFVFEEEWGPT